MPKKEETKKEEEMTFLDHLEELRWHLIRALIVVMLFAILAFVFKEFVFTKIIISPKTPSFLTNRYLCEFGNFIGVKALCINSKFTMPQRVVTGIDQKRIILIAAILEKYLHIKFSSQDIFFKLSGGFKIKESASDLGIALALLSSYFQKPLPAKSIFIAEISLTGKIKPTNQINIRVQEAEKFGLNKIFVSKGQKIKSSCKILMFENVYELMKLFPE